MADLRDVEDVLDDHTGRARAVLDYSLVVKRVVDGAKAPGFSAEAWAPLAELCAVDDFERVGTFKEVMDWDGYVAFLTAWAPTAEWECSFRRITEAGDLVFLELEERTTMGGDTTAVNSLSVYEFDAADRIRHVDVYLQLELPAGMLPDGYEAAEAAG